MRVAVNNHALAIYKKNRIAKLLYIFETTIDIDIYNDKLSQSGDRILSSHIANYDDTKKMAHDSQTVRDKENIKLSYGGPSQQQASGTN